MNLTLFNIKDNYIKLISEIEDNFGEISEEQNAELQINEKDLIEKVSNYNEIILSKQSFNDRINEEIDELKRKKYMNEKLIEKLKSNIVDAIKVFGVINVGLYRFSTRKSVSVEIDDACLLPDKYWSVKTVKSPDKMSIGKSLKNGMEVPGCLLSENYHLKRD